MMVFEWLNSRTGLKGQHDGFGHMGCVSLHFQHRPEPSADLAVLGRIRFAVQEIKTPAGLDELVDDTRRS